MSQLIRCTECRQWTPASPTAKGKQKVCCKACRDMRNCKLARKRRRENLEEYRLDERDRKQRSRDAQRARRTEQMLGLTGASEAASQTVSRKCHALGSADNLANVMAKVDQILDEVWTMSRARFRREFGRTSMKAAAQSSIAPVRAGP